MTIELKFRTIAKQAEGLARVGPWAPGGYMNICSKCDCLFEGDKRALQCLPCAIESVTKAAEERGRREERERIIRFVREIDGSTHPVDVAKAIQARGKDDPTTRVLK